MDAMDRMDDDGSPESEETHEAAVERVDEASMRSRTRVGGRLAVEQADAPSKLAEPPRRGSEPSHVEHREPPHVAASSPPAEPAPAPPAAPDHADHDPQ